MSRTRIEYVTVLKNPNKALDSMKEYKARQLNVESFCNNEGCIIRITIEVDNEDVD